MNWDALYIKQVLKSVFYHSTDFYILQTTTESNLKADVNFLCLTDSIFTEKPCLSIGAEAKTLVTDWECEQRMCFMFYQRKVVQELCSDKDEYSPSAKCHFHGAS